MPRNPNNPRKPKPIPTPEAPPAIDASQFVPKAEPDPEDRPKRKYTKRQTRGESGGTLGALMQGAGALLANISGALVSAPAPLSREESDMLGYVGNCVEQFGNTEELDENLGKYGLYLLGLSFVSIAASRILPVLLNKRKQIPATIPDADVVT